MPRVPGKLLCLDDWVGDGLMAIPWGDSIIYLFDRYKTSADEQVRLGACTPYS